MDNLEISYSRPRNVIGTLLSVLAFALLGIGLLPLGLVIFYVLPLCPETGLTATG
jgi:hypothetical protein